MSVKEQVARILRERQGNFISGEEIAEKTGVSRAAVWKCVKALKNDGFRVESATNKGYRLISCEDIISSDGIKAYLRDDLRERLIINTVRSAGSTNRDVKNKAIAGEKEGYVLASGHQTEGRGRLGRSFFSPEDTGVYMSILLRPSVKPQDATLITTAAAVSVCEALEALGADTPSIKWVNDIFIKGRKVCGILTEAGFDIENNLLDYAVLGVGLNVYAPEGGFPRELSDIAGAVFKEKREDLRNRFIALFLNSFFKWYEDLEGRNHIAEYSRRCFVVGREVDIICGDNITRGTALSLDENCGLKVKLISGETVTVSSGEISVRPVRSNI